LPLNLSVLSLVATEPREVLQINRDFAFLLIDKLESVGLVVEKHLLEALFVGVGSALIRKAPQLLGQGYSLFLSLELLNIHDFFNCCVHADILDILGKTAVFQLGQSQYIFNVKGQEFAGGVADLHALNARLLEFFQ